MLADGHIYGELTLIVSHHNLVVARGLTTVNEYLHTVHRDVCPGIADDAADLE